MFDASTFPKITFPQVLATVLGAIGPALILLSVHLSQAQQGAVDDLKALALGLFAADAGVRIGRNVHAGLRSRVIPPPPTSVLGGAELVPDTDAEEKPKRKPTKK